MDLFVVPTISFRLLYGLLIMRHGRRQVLWFGVTAHPTAEWIANQLTAACGWDQAPRYLIRDLDGAYGEIFIRRVRSMGIRDRPTSPRSPWQNGYAERLIGSIRQGMRRSYRRRTPSAQRAAVVQRLLQRLAHSFVIEQGCPGPSRCRAGREYCLPPDPGWSPSSLCPDLICDKDRVLILLFSPAVKLGRWSTGTRSVSRNRPAGVPRSTQCRCLPVSPSGRSVERQLSPIFFHGQPC
jgi:hypothetical protein